MRLLRIINSPYPFIYNLQSVLIPGGVTFLLIAIIAPFGFAQMSLTARMVYAVVFGGLISVSILIVVEGLKRFRPDWVDEDRWTVGRELILVLIVLGVISFLIFILLQFTGITEVSGLALLFYAVLTTVGISVFPIIILVLYEKYTLEKRKAEHASKLSAALVQHSSTSSSHTEFIDFYGENGKLELKLKPTEIYLLKTDGNYVEVFYEEGGYVKKHLIRNRLKVLAKQLPTDGFFQAHKSYVVNGHAILKIDGNARNYELTLRRVDVKVPVSRARAAALPGFLNSMETNT